MKKLMAFLMFLSATTMGAAAQEVSGLTQPITPSYSDILMMKAMVSSDVLATPVMLSPMPMSFAVEKPFAYGYDASHTEATSMEVSKNLSFTAVGNYRSYIGLMDVQSVSGGVQYSLGALTVQGMLSANRYLYYGRVTSQYGVSGQIAYSFSPNLSLTVFGTYYNSNPFICMAAFPYVPTTSYGGYMTVGNRRFYMNLGVERRYNPFERKMETVPIVSPTFKISNKVTVELPLGDLIEHLVEELVMKNNGHGPMMPRRR